MKYCKPQLFKIELFPRQTAGGGSSCKDEMNFMPLIGGGIYGSQCISEEDNSLCVDIQDS